MTRKSKTTHNGWNSMDKWKLGQQWRTPGEGGKKRTKLCKHIIFICQRA